MSDFQVKANEETLVYLGFNTVSDTFGTFDVTVTATEFKFPMGNVLDKVKKPLLIKVFSQIDNNTVTEFSEDYLF